MPCHWSGARGRRTKRHPNERRNPVITLRKATIARREQRTHLRLAQRNRFQIRHGREPLLPKTCRLQRRSQNGVSMINHTVAMICLGTALLAFPAMAQHRIMQEMPTQFQGRWCSVEPTEATKNRDVYSRDPSGQCAGSDGEYRVFAARIVGGGLKCAACAGTRQAMVRRSQFLDR
jgi:hypothetical protein